jgi:hypothetical protein
LTLKKLSKSTKRLISILPAIVAGTALVIFWMTIFPPKSDIPNWMTLVAEIGVGVFIAALIFILQEKTSDSLLAYNEKQEKLLRSLRLHSLGRIEYYLSMAQDTIDFDKDRITNGDETKRLNFIENLLSRHHDQFSERAPHVIDQLQKENGFVRPLVARTELEDNLRAIIDKLQLMYGVPPSDKVQEADFPKSDKVKNWFTFYDLASRLIEGQRNLL